MERIRRLGLCREGLRFAGMTRDAAHPGATCWVTKPLLRIDYAFLSAGLAAGAGAAGAAGEQSPGGGGGGGMAGPEAGGSKRNACTAAAAAAAAGMTAAVRGYQRVEDDASDHFPVVVDLVLRAEAAAEAAAAAADPEPDCN